MSDGFFPLGVNGFPHGGVHFGAASASRFDQSKGVRAIADGAIVAYKIDDVYPHLQFTQTRRWALYSTGFVLIRHKMTMPPAPGSTGAQPADETLTFFSLYMHMADWSTYVADGTLARPGWWLGVDAFRIGTKDRQSGDGGVQGAFVWSEPTAGKKKNTYSPGEHVGFLPEGSEVTIGEKRGPWGHITTVAEGRMIAARSGEYFGWEDGPQAPWVVPDARRKIPDPREGPTPDVVLDADTHQTQEGDWGWIYLHDQQAVKEPTGVGTVLIPPSEHPIQISAGTLLGQLGEYIDYETSKPLPPLPGRQLLHLEVFADESLKTFIEKSRTRAAQLPQSDRTIFVIQTGAKLVAKPNDADSSLGDGVRLAKLTLTPASPKSGPWVQVQPWINGPSGRAQQYQTPVWIARSNLSRLDSPNGLPAWKSFPLQLSRAGSPVNADQATYQRAELNSLGDANVAVDDKGVTWWRLEVGTGEGQSGTGWVCGGKQSDGSGNQPGTRWESPWAWPGFEIVDATGIQLTDAFKRNLSVTGSADPKEQKAFAPSTEAVGNSALLSKLEQTVSRLPSSSGANDPKGKDGSVIVTAVKLRQALGRRWLASELGHIILKYESEWGGGMSRWDALTPLMRNSAENWKCELERIKKLQWWDSVKGKVDGFPANPVVNHVHPVTLVGNFQTNGSLICAHCGSDLTITSSLLKAIFPNIISSNADRFSATLTAAFKKYGINTCYRASHFFGQCEVECFGFTAFREDLTYRDGDRLWTTYKTALKAGLHRLHPDWTLPQMENYSKTHLTNNDTELGEVLFGDSEYPGRDYRGRGLLHMTWIATYKQYKQASGIDVVSDPSKVQNDPYVATDSSAWFWGTRSINSPADANNVEGVTKIINPALKDFSRRKAAAKRAFELLNKGKQPCKQGWVATLTGGNGW